MDILEKIEIKYGFTYPLLYKELYLSGMLNLGEYGPNWYDTVYPKLKENPTLLLHSYDFELIGVESVSEEITRLKDPENYRQINKNFNFIPFAKSGAGDHYCFFLNEENNGNVPVVFVWHDVNKVSYLAKNLQDFIFKTLLKDMAYQEDENDVSDEEFKDDLNKVYKSHKKFLTDIHNDILQNMLNREFMDYEIILPKSKVQARGLLTDIELEKTLNEIISFDKMNHSFEYSNE